jgi:hypothetical protein
VDDLGRGAEAAEERPRLQPVSPQGVAVGFRVGDDAEREGVDADVRRELDREGAEAGLLGALGGEIRDVVRVRSVDARVDERNDRAGRSP